MPRKQTELTGFKLFEQWVKLFLKDPTKIDPQEMSLHIETFGQELERRPSERCPCVRPETRQASMGCLACRGLGFFHPEADRECVTAHIHSRRPNINNTEAGQVRQGPISLLFPLGVIPRQGDWILPGNEVHLVREVMVRASNEVSRGALSLAAANDRLNYTQPAPKNEYLLYTDIKAVDALFYMGPDGVPIKAVEELHYRIATHEVMGAVRSEVLWLKDGPEPGHAYTIRYQAPAIYMVVEPPVDRLGGGYPLSTNGQRLDQVAPQWVGR